MSTVKPPDKLQTGDGSLPFLQIKRMTKQYDDVFAVDDVSLSIEKGEIFALLGSSGCGKSTLLRMLAGFEVPTSGQIVLEGRDIVGLAPYERPINMMFQSYALFPHLTVWDNVAFGLRRDHLPKAEIEERVARMLDLVQLKAYAKRKPHQLSGGQQQRVALARSLAKWQVAGRPKKMTVQLMPPRHDERESPEQIGYNVVQGVIEDLAYLGRLTTYHVRLDGGSVVKVTQTNSARHAQAPLTWGSRVYVWWCGSDVVVLTQ